MSSYLGEKIGKGGNDAVATDDERGNEPVGSASDGAELGSRKLGGDAGHLAHFAAAQLDADDVVVRGEVGEDVVVDVEAAGDVGVVVDDDGDGARVGHLDEEGPDGLAGHDGAEVVAGERDEDVVGALLAGHVGVAQGLGEGQAAAAHGERHVGASVLDGDLAREADELALFRSIQGKAFTNRVGQHNWTNYVSYVLCMTSAGGGRGIS